MFLEKEYLRFMALIILVGVYDSPSYSLQYKYDKRQKRLEVQERSCIVPTFLGEPRLLP